MATPATLQALQALIPSFTALGKPFPPTLLSQSQSLLSLSRQRAPTLKAEEEIARAHACAEIACTRLRASLRLPVIKSGAGAPCKPSVYRKLYKFLDVSLTDAGNGLGPLTPKGTKRSADGSVKASAGGSATKKTPIQRLADNTPSKKRTVDKLIGLEFAGSVKKSKGKKTAGTTENEVSVDGNAPDFVMPAVRKLCNQFSTTAMVPHVYTGTCVVLDLAGIWNNDDDNSTEDSDESNDAKRENILALVVALYLMVLTRMRTGKMTSEVYTQVSTDGLKALSLDHERTLPQVEDWIARLKAEGWCSEQDWWQSVPQDVMALGQDTVLAGSNDEDGDDGDDLDSAQHKGTARKLLRHLDLQRDDPDGVLLPGLGTMLHAGNDWTGEDRQMDFDRWKEQMLAKLA